jgi:ATP-dependent Clp protease ATP-binding subunit ClpX
MKELLINSGGDPERASNGIVFLDEWDKAFSAASGSTDVGHFKSIAGSFELLRMLDGCDVTLDTMTGPIIINTSNCLFIMGGAFPNLDGIILQRAAGENDGPHRSIGFMAEQETAPGPSGTNELPEPTPEDLKRYGIPAEVIGRIGTVCRLKELDRNDLVNILLHSDRSPLEEQRKLFALHHITLDISETTLLAVADTAIRKKLGARGLASVLENVLSPVLFRNAENKRQMVLRLTPECFTAGAEPELRANISPGRSLVRSAARPRNVRLTS